MKTIKILFLSFLAIAMQSAKAQNWMNADVNKDRALDTKDIAAIISGMAGDAKYIATADVNRDGTIDIVDVVAAINIIKTEDAAVAMGYCPDRFHPHVIDMGSAGKWACCNMGGSLPWEKGEQCVWGDPVLHPYGYSCRWDNYPHRDEAAGYPAVKNIGDDISQTEYDVAYMTWGNTWCMPTDDQFRALLDLPYEWTEVGGQSVRKITGTNGRVLYMHADSDHMTSYYTSQYKTEKEWGYYQGGKWIEDWKEYSGYIYYSIATWYDPAKAQVDYSYLRGRRDEPFYSNNVRPIVCVPKPKPDEAVMYGYCPDTQHPHVIDMGAAGKWACCNVGASAPWERGSYYCWGGTKELSFYGAVPENETACLWGTFDDGTEWWGYKWNMWNDKAVLHPAYDIARLQWGGSWYMPTMARFEKLNDSSIRKEKATLSGTPGLRIVASNGHSIFLPYCGKKVEAEFRYDKYNPMEYWTSTSVTDFQGYCLEPNAAACHHNYWYDPTDGEYPDDVNEDFAQIHLARGVGLPVRAVQ